MTSGGRKGSWACEPPPDEPAEDDGGAGERELGTPPTTADDEKDEPAEDDGGAGERGRDTPPATADDEGGGRPCIPPASADDEAVIACLGWAGASSFLNASACGGLLWADGAAASDTPSCSSELLGEEVLVHQRCLLTMYICHYSLHHIVD